LLDNEINEVLSDSLTAVGLVGLAHFYHDPSMMFTAVYKYNSAMRKLSLQLRYWEGEIRSKLHGYYVAWTVRSRYLFL
jgi:hypothetical protein